MREKLFGFLIGILLLPSLAAGMDLVKALMQGWPQAHWTLDGDEYAGLKWRGPGSKPTEAQIQEKWNEIKDLPSVRERIALLEADLDAELAKSQPDPVKCVRLMRQIQLEARKPL